MAIVNDVVTRFSFKGSLSKLEKYNGMLSTSIKSLAKVSAGVFGLGSAFVFFVNRISQGNDGLIQLSRTSEVAIERIQQLGFAASQLGSSSEAAQGAISSLSRTIGNAAQRGNEDFMRLGISVRDAGGHIKKADQVLLEIGDRFKRFNLSTQERQDFASRLGIDKSLVQLLGTTSKELAKLFDRANKLGVLSKRDADRLSQYNDSMTQLKFGLRAVNNQIALGFAPALRRLADQFSMFIIKNKEFIKDVTEKGVGVFASFGGAIKRITGLFFDLGKFLKLSNGEIVAVGVALTLIALPIETATLGVAALVLAVDDLIVGMRGGDSVIASFFDKLNAKFNASPLKRAVKDLLGATPIAIPIKLVLDRFDLKDFQRAKSLGRDQFNIDSIPNANDTLSLLRPGAFSNVASSSTQNNVFNIQSNDPNEVARVIDNTLQSQLNNANDQFSATGGF